jgi:hypothetical protein
MESYFQSPSYLELHNKEQATLEKLTEDVDLLQAKIAAYTKKAPVQYKPPVIFKSDKSGILLPEYSEEHFDFNIFSKCILGTDQVLKAKILINNLQLKLGTLINLNQMDFGILSVLGCYKTLLDKNIFEQEKLDYIFYEFDVLLWKIGKTIERFLQGRIEINPLIFQIIIIDRKIVFISPFTDESLNLQELCKITVDENSGDELNFSIVDMGIEVLAYSIYNIVKTFYHRYHYELALYLKTKLEQNLNVQS